MTRPEYEPCDMIADPYKLNNLIGKEEVKPHLNLLKSELEDWMKRQGDYGAATELSAHERQNVNQAY